jgi:hypothetical protein
MICHRSRIAIDGGDLMRGQDVLAEILGLLVPT